MNVDGPFAIIILVVVGQFPCRAAHLGNGLVVRSPPKWKLTFPRECEPEICALPRL